MKRVPCGPTATAAQLSFGGWNRRTKKFCTWVLTAEPASKNGDGRPYGFFQALPQRVDEHSGPLLFATNAGMFDPNYKPVLLDQLRTPICASPGQLRERRWPMRCRTCAAEFAIPTP